MPQFPLTITFTKSAGSRPDHTQFSISFKDAGGSVGAAARNFNVEITQKDNWMPEKLYRLFGGRLHWVNKQYGPIRSWVVSGTRALGFLQTIFSFLSPRRRAQIVTAMKKRHYYVQKEKTYVSSNN